MAISNIIGGGTTSGIAGKKIIVATTSLPTKTEYDIKPDGYENNNFNTINLTGLKVNIKNKGSKIVIKRIGVKIFDKLYWSENISLLTLNEGDSYSYTLPDGSWDNISSKTATSGSYPSIILTFNDNTEQDYLLQDCPIKTLDPYLDKIEITKEPSKKNFYVNEIFDYSGLEVAAYKKFALSNISLTPEKITSYNVSKPNLTTAGTKSVLVSYLNKLITFKINVFGVKSFVLDQPTKTYFRNGETLTGQPGATLTRDDGTFDKIQATSITFTGFNIANKGKQTITASYYDTTTKTTSTGTYEIEVCNIESILISGNYKTEFLTNEQFVFSGIIIAKYGKASEKQINLSDVLISSPDMTNIGTKTVNITYVEDAISVSDSYQINVVGLTELEIDTANQNLSFLSNSSIALNDIKVYATIKGVKTELTRGQYAIDYTKINNTVAGNYNVEISYTYSGITLSKNISVEIYALTGITLSGGTRTYYITDGIYPSLDLSGLIINVAYSNSKVEQITEGYTSSLSNGAVLTGNTSINISYTNGGYTKTATFNVTVVEDSPELITAIDTQNLKKIYNENEVFNKNGIVVYATMKSGATNVSVAFSTNLDGKKITSNEELNIYVANKTYETGITILCDKLEEIFISQQPNKQRYKIGETLDLSGLKIQARYAYSGNKELSINEYTCNFNGAFGIGDVGTKEIVLSFGNKQATFNIAVVKLNSISVTHTGKTYIRSEKLDVNYISATKTYTDNQTENIDVKSLSFDKETLIPPVDSKYVSITATYKEQGITATATFNVEVKALLKIELSNGANVIDKVYFDYNDQISLLNYYIFKTFNDGTTELEKITDSMIYNGKNDNIKSKIDSVINYSFGGETKYYSFAFHCYYLKDIEITNPTKTTYFENEKLDLSGLSVKEVIACTDTDISDSKTAILNYEMSLQDGAVLSTSIKDIDISYTKNTITKTKSIPLTVIAIELSNIIVTGNPKLNYYVRQNLYLNDIVVKAEYNNGSSVTIPSNEYDVLIGVESVSKTVLFTENNKEKYNKQTLYVSYLGKKANLGTIEILDDVIKNISVNSLEHDTEFYIGDYFSTDKLSIIVNYESGYSETRYEDFTTDYDPYKETRFASFDVGQKSVLVNYNGYTTTYSINILVPVISKVILDTKGILLTPTNGTAYSLNGLVVNVEFANGYVVATSSWTSDVDTILNIQDGVIECTNNLGKKEITITAKNPFNENNIETTTLIIDVLPNKQLKSITLKYTSDDYDTYRIGEKFNAKGIALRAEFQDAEPVEDITNFTTHPEIGSVLRSGGRKTITVFYNYLGTELSLTYTINVLMSFESGAVKTTTYKPVFNVSEYVYEEATLNSETLGFDLILLYPDVLVKVDDNPQSKTYGKNILTDSSKINKCVGYLDLGKSSEIDNETIKNAHIVFFEDVTNPIKGDGNIVVKFPRYIPGQADKINKCKFGVLYNKRLFVSGNENYRNFDWHSSQITVATTENYKQDSNKDLTYFSDLDYCKYGSEESAVVGYDIYRDGNLLVIKSGSRNEATIYTRKLEYTNAMSYDGGVIGNGSYVEESYPCFDINKNGGVGGISDRSIVNFNGDSLVMTPAGLKLIASSSQVYDNSKYTFDVSNKINSKILKENINDIHTFVFKDRIYIKTNRGVYIGEYALKNNETKEYEWYFIDNVNSDLFFEYDNELYFANDKGEICKFDSQDYLDKDRLYINEGGITLSKGEIFISNKYRDFVKNGNSIHLLESENEIHASLAYFINANYRDNLMQDGTFDPTLCNGVVDEIKNVIRIEPYNSNNEIDFDKFGEIKDLYSSGKEIYFDNIRQVGTKIQPKVKYVLKQIENDDPFVVEFAIYDSNNQRVDLSEVDELRMSYKVSSLSYCKIQGVNEEIGENLSFNITGDLNEKLDLINYNNYQGQYSAVITNCNAVKAYYITKPLDMGSTITSKTIWSWFVVNDTDLASEVDVGYLSSRRQGDFNTVIDTTTGSKQLNFDKMVFTQLQWTSDKLPRIHPTYKTVPNVGFIRFIFKNEEPTNMVLTKLSLIYTLNNLIGGIK